MCFTERRRKKPLIRVAEPSPRSATEFTDWPIIRGARPRDDEYKTGRNQWLSYCSLFEQRDVLGT